MLEVLEIGLNNIKTEFKFKVKYSNSMALIKIKQIVTN